VRELLWTQFARSAWTQTAAVVTGTIGEGASLASVRSVGLCSASHCGGGHEFSERSSGLSSIGRRWLSRPLWWRTLQVKALL
jgi:hypothetical protein